MPKFRDMAIFVLTTTTRITTRPITFPLAHARYGTRGVIHLLLNYSVAGQIKVTSYATELK